MTIGALPVLSALTVPVRLKLVIDEIVRVHVSNQHDISTAAAVAPVGSAPRLVFFAAEGHAPAPAVTGRQFH
jgi:hypothetical protein